MPGLCIQHADRWWPWIVLCFLVVLALYSAQSISFSSHGHWPPEDGPVTGSLNQSVTLDCSFNVPTNWNLSKLHVLWFRSFTEKLADCTVERGKAPACKKSSPGARLSGNPFQGNAALEIRQLQESDVGHYQCWVIFPEAYVRVDKELRLQGEETMKGTMSGVSRLLMSGCVCAALILAARFCCRRCPPKRLLNAGYMTFV